MRGKLSPAFSKTPYLQHKDNIAKSAAFDFLAFFGADRLPLSMEIYLWKESRLSGKTESLLFCAL